MTIQDLGWNPFFTRHFAAYEAAGVEPARVVRQDRHRYRVAGASGTGTAILPGRLRARQATAAIQPVVGDWVVLEAGTGDGPAVISALLPRQSAFSRKVAGPATREQTVAANIDTLFLVSGLDGDFNLRRIERYVAQAWSSGAVPIILLNKADVCPEVEARRREVTSVAPGVAVYALSALQGEGLDVLAHYVGPGRTVAFVGSSGVGKSTLVNHLLGQAHMKTNPVRAGDSRGRHTTSHRALLLVPGGGAVIDTPGLRELQLWTSAGSLQDGFADLEALAAGCRFRDCRHEGEPGCALQAALAEGLLDAGRYRNYLKMQRELDYLACRQQEQGRREDRQRDRKGARLMRQINRHNPKRR